MALAQLCHSLLVAPVRSPGCSAESSPNPAPVAPVGPVESSRRSSGAPPRTTTMCDSSRGWRSTPTASRTCARLPRDRRAAAPRRRRFRSAGSAARRDGRRLRRLDLRLHAEGSSSRCWAPSMRRPTVEHNRRAARQSGNDHSTPNRPRRQLRRAGARLGTLLRSAIGTAQRRTSRIAAEPP